LSYLKRFPIDVLKIDHSFIEGMDVTDRDMLLVQTVIDLGRMLGLEIVAEGIERREQLMSLKDLHCDLGQGFLFAEALDARTAGELLRNHVLNRSLPPTRLEDTGNEAEEPRSVA
jgi:EAL domain-containing protein (putative c-di-GMP-specific phosphodiesterase class I)